MSALTDVAKQAMEYFCDRGSVDTYSEEWGFYLALRDALAQEPNPQMHEKSPEMHEKSLGAENSAGVDALRDAAQRQLDALVGYRREIGLLTGVPDEQSCDAEVAARAALEQEQAEPVAYTTGHCENHKHKGGCQLHNLQCGWPDCDRKPAIAPPRRTMVPLTEEQIEVAAKSVPAAVFELMHGHEITVEKFRAALAEFARAIERAHGIGEEE